jgi:hypothetical protein
MPDRIEVTVRQIKGRTGTFSLYRISRERVQKIIRDACLKACPESFVKGAVPGSGRKASKDTT